jgi:hypothetical protein
MPRSSTTRGGSDAEVIEQLRRECAELRRRETELEAKLAEVERSNAEAIAAANARADELEAKIPGAELAVACGRFGITPAELTSGDIEASELLVRVLAERQRDAVERPPARDDLPSRFRSGGPPAESPSVGEQFNRMVRESRNGHG